MHFEESPLLQRPGNAGMELRKKEYDCATYHHQTQPNPLAVLSGCQRTPAPPPAWPASPGVLPLAH